MFLLKKEILQADALPHKPTLWDGVFLTRHHLILLSNITVLQGESSLQQHKLLVGMLGMNEHVKRKREVFVSRCKEWKLKEAEIKKDFRAKVEERLAMRVDGNGNETCGRLRDCLPRSS